MGMDYRKERPTDQLLRKISDERNRQDEKWGEQNHNPLLWLSIIGEEYGEMCKEANEFSFSDDLQRMENLKTEAIQCAASCVAMIESIERNVFNKDKNEELNNENY